MTMDPTIPVDASAPSESFVDGVPVATDLPTADLYRLLPQALRDLDEQDGNGLLRRFLTRPAELAERWMRKAWRVPRLLDYRYCPDALLDHLRAHVGFGAGSGTPDRIASRLSAADLRRLIKLAVPYWQRRGRRDALLDAIRTLTGVTPQILDWFYLRAIVGEVLLGVGGVGGDPLMIYHDVTAAPVGTVDGEVQVAVRVPDEAGTLDRTLVVDLCSLARPIGERYEVAFVDFLDTFLQGRLAHWLTLAGAAATVRTPDTSTTPPTLAAMVLAEGTAEGMDTPLAPSWTGYIWSLLVGLQDVGQTLRLQFYMPALSLADGLYVDLDPPGTVTLGLRQAGVDVAAVAVAADLTIGTGLRGVRVDVQPAGADTLVRVYLDANLVIDQAIAGVPWAGGTAAVQAVGATGLPVVVSGVEVWRRPLDVRALLPG